MGNANLILLAISLVLQLFLLVVLVRERTYWKFPFFFAYTVYSVPATATLWAVSPHYNVYFYAFWANAAVLAALAILALHEVFRKVFFGFYVQFHWFRLLFPSAVTFTLVFVLWATRHRPPVRNSVLLSSLVLLGLTVNFIQVGLFFLFIVIARTFRLRWRFAPLGILLGFTLSALGSTLTYWAIPVFGTRLENLVKYVPPVAYILAIMVWLDTFLRPEPGPEHVSVATLQQLVEDIRRDTIAIKRFLEKSK